MKIDELYQNGSNHYLEEKNSWNKGLLKYLPTGSRFQWEGHIQEVLWRLATPVYEYYLWRAESLKNYDHHIRAIRTIERKNYLDLPFLTDEMIEELNGFAETSAMSFWQRRFPRTAYESTRQEKDLRTYIESQIGSEGLAERKIPVGPFVGDILLFGLMFPTIDRNRFQGLMIEVNGPIHQIHKGTNDVRMKTALESLGIFVVDFDNHLIPSASNVLPTVAKSLSELKVARKIDRRATQALLRRVHLRNIATWLSFTRVEEIVARNWGVTLNLEQGIELLKAHKRCPAVIKSPVSVKALLAETAA